MRAIVEACHRLSWDVEPIGDGLLRATHIKDGKHTVVIDIRYDDTTYSLTYVRSDNMLAHRSEYSPGIFQPGYKARDKYEDSTARAATKHRELFADRREAPYSRPDYATEIHPNYEYWVYYLLDVVHDRLQLVR